MLSVSIAAVIFRTPVSDSDLHKIVKWLKLQKYLKQAKAFDVVVIFIHIACGILNCHRLKNLSVITM